MPVPVNTTAEEAAAAEAEAAAAEAAAAAAGADRNTGRRCDCLGFFDCCLFVRIERCGADIRSLAPKSQVPHVRPCSHR